MRYHLFVFVLTMSYLIATYKEGVPYAIIACQETNKFQLVKVDSDSVLSKVFSHPYRAGAYNILAWIEDNDSELAAEQLGVFDEAKFRK